MILHLNMILYVGLGSCSHQVVLIILSRMVAMVDLVGEKQCLSRDTSSRSVLAVGEVFLQVKCMVCSESIVIYISFGPRQGTCRRAARIITSVINGLMGIRYGTALYNQNRTLLTGSTAMYCTVEFCKL